MATRSPLEALDMLYAVGIPALFWIGLVAGVAVGASTSSPYFLGNRFCTRLYIGVIVLFITNLVHRFLGVPLFGSMGIEYTLIAAGVWLFFVFLNVCDEASKRKSVADDPKAQLCPKCGVILDKIFRVCPRCDTPLPLSDASPSPQKSGGESK